MAALDAKASLALQFAEIEYRAKPDKKRRMVELEYWVSDSNDFIGEGD